MIQSILWAHLLALAMVSTPPATAPAAATAPVDRVTGWREDLRMLAGTLATKHTDAFTVTSREQFKAAVVDLDARLPELSDTRAFFEFKRLVTLVGDAHTSLGDGKGRFATPFYPFSALILDDGMYITASTPEHKDLLGRKIIRIGATPTDEAIELLGSIAPHENRAWLRNQARMLLMSPEALAFVGVIDDPQRGTFTLADAAGDETTVTLSPMQPGERQSVAPELASPRLAPTLRPRTPGLIYGCMMLADSRDLYVWYDACQNMQNRSVAKFATETLERIERDKPERIIIDLRRNGGGNSALIQPLIMGLAAREDLKTPGRLFVLIGRGTFSSGLWAAEDLRRVNRAILIGGPTGGKPNSFGEQRSVELPHSGLTLYYSTKKWVRDRSGDPASLEPAVHAEPAWADLAAGRDVEIEAARAYKPK